MDDMLIVARFSLLRQTLIINLRAYSVSTEDIATTSLGSGGTTRSIYTSMAKRKYPTTSRRTQVPLDAKIISGSIALLGCPHLPKVAVLDFLWLLFSKAAAVSNVDELVCCCSSPGDFMLIGTALFCLQGHIPSVSSQ